MTFVPLDILGHQVRKIGAGVHNAQAAFRLPGFNLALGELHFLGVNSPVRADHHLVVLPVLAPQNQLAQHGAKQVGRGHRQVGDVHALRRSLFQHQRLCQQVLHLRQGEGAHLDFRVQHLDDGRLQLLDLRPV